MQDKDAATHSLGLGAGIDTASRGASVLHLIFRRQILALIVTAVVVLALLIGFTRVPQALAISLCAVASCSLIIFPFMTASSAKNASGLRAPQKTEYIAVSVGLALAQLIFVLPIIACIIAPTVNFRTMLFG